MAEVLALIGSVFSSAISAASSAGSFIAANAGTIGTALSAGSTIYGGVRGLTSANATAKELKRKGDNELAVAQREAMRRQRETQLVVSRQNAVAAASGAGATDPSVIATEAKTQQEGDYNSMLDMYNGMVSRADLYHEAATTKKEGVGKLLGSFMDAGSTIYSDYKRRSRARAEYANV